MPVATFETPDGEEVEIDSDDVIHVRLGPDPDTTLIEMEDGDEIIVVASQIEVAAELELNPLEVVDPEEDDESIEALVDGEDVEDEDDES